MQKILVIHHESAGCMNNMLALARELERKRDSQLEHIHLKLRNKLLTPCVMLFAWLAPYLPVSMLRYVAPLFFKGKIPSGTHYDVLISTLGSGEAPAVFLSACYPEITHFHIGTPRRISRRHFQVIITNFGISPKKGEIVLDQALTRFGMEEQSSSFLKGHDTDREIAAFLIGGTAADVDFDEHYWDDILAFILAFASQNAVRWVITTTPRTPCDIVDTLQKMAEENSDIIAHYSHYESGGKSYLHEYLQACQVVFVTAESVSMIADAMAYPRPIFALGNALMIKNPRINGFLDTQKKQNTIQYVHMRDIRQGIAPPYTALVQRPKWSNAFWVQLDNFHPATVRKLIK